MKIHEVQSGDKPAPALRVVYGNEMEEPESAKGVDRQQPPLRLNSEAEAFWAGRNSAARLSARVAA